MKSASMTISKKLMLPLIILVFFGAKLMGGESQKIRGVVLDRENKQAIPFASIALYTTQDSVLVSGTVSKDDGQFTLLSDKDCSCYLKVSYLGYKTWLKNIDTGIRQGKDTLSIYLEPTTIEMSEAVVVADRAKVIKSVDKTTFYINSKIQDVSNTGMDVLKYIPGFQVDLMQNLKLEGSSNLLILVDGKERDKGYISQLNAKEIDKVEVINTPGAKFDANITGVVNIILKKERNSGLSGNVVLDIPTSKSELYLFPAMNLNVGLRKLNLFLSYNGNIRYFDLVENSRMTQIGNNQSLREISNWQNLRQKDWEHRFNYGFDYYFDDKNQFNFYAFADPYSNEKRSS